MSYRLNMLEKRIRAQVIKEHMKALRIKKAVCFTCGNAGRALQEAGIPTTTVGPNEEIKATHWYSQAEIARTFPDHFNATSGDIPLYLIAEIGRRMREALGPTFRGGPVRIGSGETVVALAMAYPELRDRIEPYRDGTEATAYERGATLNPVVAALWGTDKAYADCRERSA